MVRKNGRFCFKETGEEKYRKAAELLRSQLEKHPRTKEGGFWHKKIYPHQMWLDGLYMGTPFYAEYGQIFQETAAFDDVANQLILMDRHSRDPKSGLHYHGWDERREQRWADKQTGCSPSFWCRAEGWYAMALVDVLDFLPGDHPKREQILGILDDLIKALILVQDKTTNTWNEVLDRELEEGNYSESSSSAMFTYTIAKAVRMGYVHPSLIESAERAFEGLVNTFVKEDSNNLLTYLDTVYTAGLGCLGDNPYRDGTFEYYVSCPVEHNNLIGIGAFILASVEIEELRSKK